MIVTITKLLKLNFIIPTDKHHILYLNVITFVKNVSTQKYKSVEVFHEISRCSYKENHDSVLAKMSAYIYFCGLHDYYQYTR